MSSVDLGYTGELFQKSSIWNNKILGQPITFLKELKPNCSNCSSPLLMILQIDCPTTSIDFRSLYVFTCVGESCIQIKKFWKVFRCQKRKEYQKPVVIKKKEPDFQWFEDQDDWGDDGSTNVTISDKDNKGDNDSTRETTSDKDNNVKDILDITNDASDMSHATSTEGLTVNELISTLEHLNVEDDNSFLGFSIYIEQEKIVKKNKKMDAKFQQYLKDSGLQSISHDNTDIYEKISAYGDRVAEKFITKVGYNPLQIIRYDLGGSPIHISSEEEKKFEPKICSYCKSESVYEFQLMPELCRFLNKQEVKVDFGTIIISTCSNSCWNNNTNGETVCEEHVTVQLDPDTELIENMLKSRAKDKQ